MENIIKNKKPIQYLKIVLLILSVGLLAWGLSFSASQCHALSIDIYSKKLYMKLNSDCNFRLIDVRQKWEYDQGHIQGAELVPLQDILKGEFNLDKYEEIVVYCRSGRRSSIAAKTLTEMGYTDVKNLKGGILEWEYGLVDKPKAPSNKTFKQEVTK